MGTFRLAHRNRDQTLFSISLCALLCCTLGRELVCRSGVRCRLVRSPQKMRADSAPVPCESESTRLRARASRGRSLGRSLVAHPSSSWLVLAGATVGASWALHRRHRGAAFKLRLREYLTCKSSSWVGALKFSGWCPGFLHCFVTGTQRQEVRDQWAYPTPRCTGSQGPTTSIHPFTTSPGQRALARKNGLTEPGPSDCRVPGAKLD